MERCHRVALTTSLRSGRRVDGRGEEIGGSLLVGTVDPESEVFVCERQIALPVSRYAPNRRAARGVAPFAGCLAVCNAAEVFLFDPGTWEIVASASHPWLGDIHSIAARDGILYLSATAADAVLGLDESLRPVFAWWAGDEPELDRHLADHHRERHRAGEDVREKGRFRDRFHLNHVAFDPGGDLIVNLPDLEPGPGESKLWNVTRRRFELPASSDRFPGRIHDGVILEDHHYLGWTEAGRFLELCRRTGEILSSVDCSVPLGTTTGNPVAARHGWLRGAALLGGRPGGRLFLVGQSRLNLFLVDMTAGTRRGPLRLEGVTGPLGDPGLAVYCISELPEI